LGAGKSSGKEERARKNGTEIARGALREKKVGSEKRRAPDYKEKEKTRKRRL